MKYEYILMSNINYWSYKMRILHVEISNESMTLLKIEAAKQDKKMPQLVEEIIKSYAK